jgi:hypothetical protein
MRLKSICSGVISLLTDSPDYTLKFCKCQYRSEYFLALMIFTAIGHGVSTNGPWLLYVFQPHISALVVGAQSNGIEVDRGGFT